MGNSPLVPFEQSLNPDRWTILLIESFEFVDLQFDLKDVLLSVESFLELRDIESHEGT